MMTEQQSQNLLLKVDLLSIIRNNKFTSQGEKFRGNRDREGESYRSNLLFSYYELGFRCFELNLFSHCSDSVRFEKFKPEQALPTLDWKDSLSTCNSLYLT